MSVSSITSAFSQYAQKVTTGTSSGGDTAAQEANESAAVTAKEAAHGDRAAKAKIARQQQSKQLEAAAPAAEPGKGAVVDTKA